MSLLKNKGSVQELINIDSFRRNGIKTRDGFYLTYFFIEPYNLAVLGFQAVKAKIRQLQSIMEAVGKIEMLCVPSSQSYDNNIEYLISQMRKETSSVVKELIQAEIEYLEETSINMSTSRDFFFILRFRNEGEKQIDIAVNQYLQLIQENGLNVRKASESELKRIFAIYYSGNIYDTQFYDFDGQEFAGAME